MKKLFVVGVIALFLGLAIAPSINANISKASIESELVEITTEIRGINGVTPNTVLLSKEDAEEVEKLIDDIERRLDNVETREESVEIFNETIVELDKYGLLGGLSVEQTQKLVTRMYKKSNLISCGKLGFFEKQTSYIINKNVFCLVTGRTNYTYSVHRLNPWLCYGSIYIFLYGWSLGLSLYEKYPGIILLLPLLLAVTFGLDYLWYISGSWADRMPIALFNVFGIGFDDGIHLDDIWYALGWVWSIGLLGIKKWEGELLGNLPGIKIPYIGPLFTYPAVWGFNGIKIWLNEDGSEKYYLGSAFAVGLDEKEGVKR